MAIIIENKYIKRRTIKLNVEDVISIVKQYQTVTRGYSEAPIVRDLVSNSSFYIPEDI